VYAYLLVTEAQTREGWLTDVRDEHVRRLGKALEDPAGRLPPKVEHDSPLVTVEAEKGRPFPLALGPEVTAFVPVRGLELDDISTEISEECRGIRAREHGTHIEDADALQCACRRTLGLSAHLGCLAYSF
jgi:hypothetical protein